MTLHVLAASRLAANPQRCERSPRRLFRQHAVQRIHALGARVTFELLDELVRHHPELEDDIDRRLDRYGDLDPEILHAVGADRFLALPIRAVRR